MKNLYNITNNVSRETFNYIKNNPGSKRMEIITALGHRGFGKASVSSLIAQMRKSGMVHDTDGLWYADVNEYTPIKNSSYKKKTKAQKKGTTGIGALLKAKLENTPMPIQDAMDAAAYAMGGYTQATPKRIVSLVRSKSPEDILKDMTVYQAHDLYRHLKQMFGG
jgi:NAD(P)H-hydrate repair Nnr-like enzyme with NAD(P)H-hydrate dehydratase domain